MSLYACVRCGAVRDDSGECMVCGYAGCYVVELSEDDPVPVPDDEEVDDGPDLVDLPYVGEEIADRMRDAGYASVADVAAADPDELAAIHGVGDYRASDMVDAAGDYAE